MEEYISEFVRVERARKKLSQEDLATISKTTTRTIQKMEAGEKVHHNTVVKVASALGFESVFSVMFIKIENIEE